MSPAIDDGSSQQRSSTSSRRSERFKQVSMQSGMPPVLECLDSLDGALRRLNEEPYDCAENARMRLKATNAVRNKWPGREGDREPLEETVLQSVALLKVQLGEQMDQHLWLREAIGGDELRQVVHAMASHGPFKREDASLRSAAQLYVTETLDHLHKVENEGRVFLDGHVDGEERLASHIREASDKLSSSTFLHDRAAAEETRTQVAMQLLSHFLAKAKAAAEKSGQLEELLSRKLTQFNSWHAEEEQSYREEESAQASQRSMLKEQLAQLKEFGQRNTEEHAEMLSETQAEERADTAELQLIRKQLEEVLKSVRRIAQRHQRRCLTRSEKERVFRYVSDAIQEQEAVLRSQLDLARSLAQRWQRGRELHGQFVAFVRKAYDGLMQMAQQKSEEMRRHLQADSSKFTVLAKAIQEDLSLQRTKMLVALQKTFDTARRQEEELEVMERSFKPQIQLESAQKAFQESQESVKLQEQQVEALVRLKETLVNKCQDFEEALRGFVIDEPSKDSAQVWLSTFFYTARRQRLRTPSALSCGKVAALCYGGVPLETNVSGDPTSIPSATLEGDDQTLRRMVSDPALALCTSSNTDFLVIRDECSRSWSLSGEAMALEDL